VGPGGSALLQTALFGFCFGVMAVYLVVIGDILAGAAQGFELTLGVFAGSSRLALVR
jgi:amino acid permease